MEAKSISQDHRLRDFPHQGLKISAGKLFCQPCAITLPNIKGSIASHLATQKHKQKLEAHVKQMQADSSTRTELSEYFEANPDEGQESSHHQPFTSPRPAVSHSLLACAHTG